MSLLYDPKYRLLFTIIKSIKNGFIYGVKVRLPHSFVNSLIFSKGDLKTNILFILNSTITHATGLASFASFYKFIKCVLNKLNISKSLQSMLSAGIVGFFVFGRDTKVNEQINLYLLSRIIIGMIKLLYQQSISFSTFADKAIASKSRLQYRWFAMFVWAFSLWFFENHRDCLQGSLKSSMTFIFQDSDSWSSWKDLFL